MKEFIEGIVKVFFTNIKQRKILNLHVVSPRLKFKVQHLELKFKWGTFHMQLFKIGKWKVPTRLNEETIWIIQLKNTINKLTSKK
ncbi:hypothetical protein C4B24_03325, partial [Mycoplasma marinum]